MILALVILPLIFLVISSFGAEGEVLDHLLRYEITHNLINTVLLASCTVFLTVVLGSSLAWMTTRYEFFGRKTFEKLLILPIAIPTYVFAFVYVGLLDFAGPLQTYLRSVFGNSSDLFNIRSFYGLVFFLSLSLYPYVYLMAKSAFSTLSQDQYDCARSLGHSSRSVFWRLSFKLALPWISGGALLVAMESFADFGAAAVAGVDVFTTSIYKSWFGFYSLPSASLLSLVLVLIALILLTLKNYNQKSQKNAFLTAPGERTLKSIKASKLKSGLYFTICLTVTFLGLIVPVVQLSSWSLSILNQEILSDLLGFLFNTSLLALLGSGVCVVGALSLVLIVRVGRFHRQGFSSWVAPLGYAMPGSVLAVGVFLFLTQIDSTFGQRLLAGSVVALTIGYLIRFLAISYSSIDSGQKRIDQSLDEVASSLGVVKLKQIWYVHLPLLKKSLIAGLLLTFIDICKEMPLTLMTRPYGWDTLAIKIYEFTSEGEWELASPPALAIIIIGIIPVVFLERNTRTEKL